MQEEGRDEREYGAVDFVNRHAAVPNAEQTHSIHLMTTTAYGLVGGF